MQPTIKKIVLKVHGMSCTNCAMGIKLYLEKNGFKNVNVNFSTAEVSFEIQKEEDVEKGIQLIESIGYSVDDTDKKKKNNRFHLSIEVKFLISLAFTLPLLLSMFFPIETLHNPYFQLFLTLPVFIIGFFHFGVSAYKSLKTGIANMDVLIFMGSSAAFIYSLMGTIRNMGHDYMFYETTASIITIVLFGNLIEHRSVKKTTSAIDDLLKLQPAKAKKIISDMSAAIEEIEEVEISKVAVNDRIIVNEGDKIPVDGLVFWGSATIDESMLTGESIPVLKQKGDKLIAGSYVVQGNVKMTSDAVGDDTLLSQIIELVKNAQNQKPKLQNLADKVSAIFVPTVLIITVITFIISYLLLKVGSSVSLIRSIAVLVIACPCALGLAIPTAVVVGVGKMAKRGILIKGGITIDKFANIEKIVFDKTGTLTTGNFKIKNITLFNSDIQQIKSILSGLEKFSSHPIAKSIVKELSEENIIPFSFQKIEEIKGIGLIGWDESDNKYEVGSFHIVKETTTDTAHNIYVIINGDLKATVDIEDEIKPEVRELMSFFSKNNISTVMLSGDKKEKCVEVAEKIGIQEVYYEKLPAEKLNIISELSKKYKIAMVGDGINDAPALAQADVGISLSNATQIAVQSSQIILLNGQLLLLKPAFIYSKKTLAAIKQNLFWAFFYNIIAIPFAAAGFLTPMVAAFSMAASDIVVVMNSLRLKLGK